MSQRERSVAVHRIEFDVDWPPGHVAAYLVDCDEPTLVDAGMPGDAHRAVLADRLDDHGLAIADVEHLVLTHPHIDHMGLVPDVIEVAEPTLYAPASVRDRFDRDLDDLERAVRENAVAAGLSGGELETAVGMAVESMRRNRELLPPDRVDVWIAPDETVDVAGTPVTATHTPGHQADHLCYEVDIGEDALVAGDMALEPFRSVAMHAGLDREVDDAIAAFYDALDALERLDPDRVYPAHGPVHDGFHDAVARDRDSLDRTLDRTVDALDSSAASNAAASDHSSAASNAAASDHSSAASNAAASDQSSAASSDDSRGGQSTAVDIARQRAGDRPIHYIVPEVVGALRYLERDGRVASDQRDGVSFYRPA